MDKRDQNAEGEPGRLFVRRLLATHLAPELRQDAGLSPAIDRAAGALVGATSSEGAAARRLVAIEYTAWAVRSAGRARGWPTQEHREQATEIVDALSDGDLRERLHGGLIVLAYRMWSEHRVAPLRVGNDATASLRRGSLRTSEVAGRAQT